MFLHAEMGFIEYRSMNRPGEPGQKPRLAFLEQRLVAEPVRICRQNNRPRPKPPLHQNCAIIRARVNNSPDRVKLIEKKRAVAGYLVRQRFILLLRRDSRQNTVFFISLQRGEPEIELPLFGEQYANIALFGILCSFSLSSRSRPSARCHCYQRRRHDFASGEDRIKGNHEPATAADVLLKVLYFDISKPQLARLNSQHKKRRVTATLHSQ